MNQHINTVMGAMGWPDDAFIPIANDENRELMKSIEQKMEAKRIKIQHREQLTERVEMLRNHNQNAEAGVVQNLVRSILFSAKENNMPLKFIVRKLLMLIGANATMNIICLNWPKTN